MNEDFQKTRPTLLKRLLAYVLFAVILVAVGVGVGYGFAKSRQADTTYIEPVFTRKANPLYPLIKPLVRIDFPSQINFEELSGLRTKANDFIKQQQAAGKIKRASFYFRDTNNAHWVGVGQDDSYHPASLFKLPYLMALYKNIEINPQILNERLFFSGITHNSDDQIQRLVSGREYTVDELARAMIKQSDNDAKDLLLTKIDPQFLAEALNDNNVSLHDVSKDLLSPRIYTTFFRTLYNATFLSPAMSQRALGLLSEVDFNEGLVAGTPSTIKIAHKFGQYADLEDGRVVALELHDCGLVYFPEHPYYLCVMTEGYSREDLGSVIKGVANIAYTEFSKVYTVKK